HKLKADSAAAKFSAAWARAQFAASKGSGFNAVEKRLIPLADSKSRLASWAGGASITALQPGWLPYLPGPAPPSLVWGFLRAFGAAGEAYDPKKHDPDSWNLPGASEGLPARSPETPDDGARGPIGPLAAKLIAAAIPVVPVYFLTIPILLNSTLLATGLFAGAALAAAAMPLMPKSERFPIRLRKAPGWLLAGAGLASLVWGPWSLSLA